MAQAHYFHTATLLPDGRVLVAAGLKSPLRGATLNSAELYDPTTGTWTLAAPLAEARYGHAASLLSDGEVLVAGGWTIGGPALGSVELYNPVTNSWSNTGSLNFPRYYHTAVTLLEGSVLVAGGFNNGSNQLPGEIYDPTSGTWMIVGKATFSPAFLTSTLLFDGRVLLAAGTTFSFTTAKAQVYDPLSNKWNITRLITAREEHTATLLQNGKLLIAGGFDRINNSLASAELGSAQ